MRRQALFEAREFTLYGPPGPGGHPAVPSVRHRVQYVLVALVLRQIQTEPEERRCPAGE